MRIEREDLSGRTGPLCLLFGLFFDGAAYISMTTPWIWVGWLLPPIVLVWLFVGALGLWQRQYKWVAASFILLILPGLLLADIFWTCTYRHDCF